MTATSFETVRWNPLTRIAFRLAFSYLVLYNVPFPFQYFWPEWAFFKYEAMWRSFVSDVAGFFGFTITTVTTSIGDTPYDYLKMLCMLVVAVVATLIWSILDRRRPNYTRLHEWLRVYVRFALAAVMITYGAMKVISPTQFGPLTLDRLVQPFGDASPMALLGTFMAASPAYTFLAGAAELLGGLLLTFRRTTLLGALITMVVMSNVVALDFFYDVPAKLFASHVLLMSVFLVLPEARRLAQFFVLHPPSLLFHWKWLRVGSIVLRTALVAFIVFSVFKPRIMSGQPPRSPLRGIWNVDTLTVDGVDHPPLATDGTRWRRIVFDYAEWVTFQNMDDSRTLYGLGLYETQGAMYLGKREDRKWSATLNYKRPSPNEMVLDGPMDGHTYHAVLHKAEAPSFRLTKRGFHWINESPFNR